MTEKPLHRPQKAAEKKEDKEPYKARNKVVESKERFYDRLNLTVRQVDIFIVICVVLVLLLAIVGKFLF